MMTFCFPQLPPRPAVVLAKVCGAPPDTAIFCSLSLAKKCAVKGAGLQRVQLPPGNWFAPPGSNRSGSGGNEAVGAFDVKGRLATPRACRP